MFSSYDSLIRSYIFIEVLILVICWLKKYKNHNKKSTDLSSLQDNYQLPFSSIISLLVRTVIQFPHLLILDFLAYDFLFKLSLLILW